jgi:hypothetical protein
MKEALKLALEYMNERLEDHDSKFMRHPATEAERDIILANIKEVKEALAQPAQEPDELTIAYMSGLYDGKKKRPWVGLTEVEIQDIWDVAAGSIPGWSRHITYALAIEAKLKEKNT